MNYEESPLILEEIKKAKKILVNCHRRPDPDSIASATAMYQMLQKLDKQVDIICPDNVPEFLNFLPHADLVKKIDFENFDYKGHDLFLVLDSEKWNLVTGGNIAPLPKRISLVAIDHHQDNDKFGAINLVDGKTSSCCEVLFKIFEDWGIKINKNIATSLLTGIIGDTLCFRIPTTSEQTLLVGSKLIEEGADRLMIVNNLFNRIKLPFMKFFAKVLERAELDSEGQFAWSAIPYKVYKGLNQPAAKVITANMFFGSFADAKFGILMIEEREKFMTVSLRSTTGFDVAKIAAELGGGGHKEAAGGKIEAPFEEAVKKVLEVARKYAKKTS